MLTQNNAGTLINPNTETEVIHYIADGSQYFLGFMGSGSYSGEFKLYVKKPGDTVETCYYVYQTSPSNRTAYVVDRVVKFEVGTELSLRIKHDSTNPETFYGTLLGGVS